MTMWVPFFSFSPLFNDPLLLSTHVPRTTFKQALQATARKMSYYNGYVLWAGGQPDFQYAASGDSSDYMYATLGEIFSIKSWPAYFTSATTTFSKSVVIFLWPRKIIDQDISLGSWDVFELYNLRVRGILNGVQLFMSHKSQNKMANRNMPSVLPYCTYSYNRPFNNAFASEMISRSEDIFWLKNFLGHQIWTLIRFRKYL